MNPDATRAVHGLYAQGQVERTVVNLEATPTIHGSYA